MGSWAPRLNAPVTSDLIEITAIYHAQLKRHMIGYLAYV